jgi:hypothetical protein
MYNGDGRRMPSDGKSSHGLWPGELKKTLMGSKYVVVSLRIKQSLFRKLSLLNLLL